MRSSNPALSYDQFAGFRKVFNPSETMSMSGTVWKTVISLVLVAASASLMWLKFFKTGGDAGAISGYMMLGLFGGLIFSVATIFKKDWAPFTTPAYSVCQGLFIGGISAIFELSYPGIAMQAVSLTFATLTSMLVLYQTGVIRASEPLKKGVMIATASIGMVYLASLILSIFGVTIPFIHANNGLGILFSVIVVGIAAFNLIIDFDFIEQGSRYGLPKYMEWYGAFALMVTLIWLYLEILRLLSKIYGRQRQA